MIGLAERARESKLRLARHYVEVTLEARRVYRQGWDSSVSALAMLDAERAQVEQWLAWLSAEAPAHDEAARMLVMLMQEGGALLAMRLTASDMLTWHKHALTAARRLGDTAGEADHLTRTAVIQFTLGRTEESEAALRQAIDLAERFSHPHQLADGLLALEHRLSHKGELDSAQSAVRRALDLYAALGDEWGRQNCLYELGWIAVSRGRWSEAETFLRQCHAICLRLGDQIELASALNMLGTVMHKLGRHEESARVHAESLDLLQRLGDQRGAVNTLMGIAVAYDREANYPAAQDYYLRALAIARTFGNVGWEATILGNLGFSAYLEGRYADAALMLEESAALYRRQRWDYNLCVILANLIAAVLPMEDYQRARGALLEGMEIARSIAAEPLKATMVVAAVQTWAAAALAQPDAAAQRDMMAYAAVWSGMVLACPGAEQENRDEIEKLRPQMEAILGEDGFTALIKEGGESYIDEVIAGIVSVLRTSP
ncbi:MAG: tetratricopeptide repeat protein [Anaerolineae bacterium]|nr:tetratricopeptide repeat protein [Anaerolineae bacterium]